MKHTSAIFVLFLLVFAAQSQPVNRYDVVISEIMANPSAATSLPNVKYLELCNTSTQTINLLNWTISDGSNTARINRSFELRPDSFIVISTVNGASALSSISNSISVSNFPALRVNGDLLVLRSPENQTIHAVAYSRTWYANEVKSAGGWSLEMMDTKRACEENNWKASIADAGGTPGYKNSVSAVSTHTPPLKALHAYAEDSLHLIIHFNKTLDSNGAALPTHYRLNNLAPASAAPIPPLFNAVLLSFAQPLQRNIVYALTVDAAITDCSGKQLGATVRLPTGLSEKPNPFDIVINELLFNPPPDGVDYIELFNRSKKIINLKHLYITNRNATGTVGTLKQVSETDLLLFPGDYLALTEDNKTLQQHFTAKNPEAIFELNSMPTMPNESGTIVLFNATGDVIDELAYNENWHFSLITTPKGVALERTDPEKPTQDAANWHSAATSAGFGTPGYQNSQYSVQPFRESKFSITPKVFSPDNDGLDDYLTIQYQFEEMGNVCNISVFDAQGRMVRKLVKNGLCGKEGYYRWDGLGDNNQVLKTGIYIILTETYTLNGKTSRDKKAVTLARRL